MHDTQKNCRDLADHLEHNVTDAEYNQSSFHCESRNTSCAAGHAAWVGIGGLVMDVYDVPYHTDFVNSLSRYGKSIITVFGEDKRYIFHSDRGDLTRLDAIDLLRKA
jgi:hypothetical protein